MTVTQWQVAAEVVAELCASYNIAVTPRTVLAHGEVQAALGVAQLQKWDPLVLPFTPNVPTAIRDPISIPRSTSLVNTAPESP